MPPTTGYSWSRLHSEDQGYHLATESGAPWDPWRSPLPLPRPGPASLEPCRVNSTLFKPGQQSREGRMASGRLFTLLCWGAGLGWGPGRAEAQRVMLGGGKAGGQGPGDPRSTSQLPWFLTSVPLTLCSTFSVAHTCPHNFRSPNKYVPMSPAGHPLCSLNTQGTRSGREVAGSKFPSCRHLAGTLAQAHVFISVNFSTRARKRQLWKLPASAMTRPSTPAPVL